MPDRSDISRRVAYEPASLEETFMVPLLGRALDEVIPSGTGRAIDIGCGGQPLRALIEERGWDYAGLDVVASPGIELDHVAPIDAEDFPEIGRFDLLVCTEVLEHVARWERAWANMSALASPGAILVVTCPAVYPLHEEPHDFFRPTEFAIRAHAERSGWEVVATRRLGGPWEVLGTVLAAVTFNGRFSHVANSVRYRTVKLMARWAPRTSGRIYLSNVAVLRHRRWVTGTSAPG
jgi:SAM-dependent methyltransferase